MGIDGNSGKIVNAKDEGILDTFATKAQTIRAAIECAAMILRIDDIVSGQKAKQGGAPPGAGGKMTSMESGEHLANKALDGEGDQVN